MKNINYMTRNKALYIDWNALHDGYDDILVLRALTARQYTALIAMSEYFKWLTRWLNPPTQELADLFAGETIFRLSDDVEICALVIACITDDDDVRNALSQWFVDQINDTSSDVYNAVQQVYQQNVGGQPMPSSVSGAPLVEVPDCNLDVLFGAVSYLIEQMNTNNTDAFEVAEEITNALERASLLISAIPIFETLPIDEVLDYAQSIWTDDLFEAYSANDTTEYRDTLRCDLFCLARDNGCTLTVDLLFHYFVTRIGGDPLQNLDELIAYLTFGTWSGTQINDIFYAAQCIVLKLGNQFFGLLGLKSLKTYLAIGARSPDDTWMIICDECPEVCIEPEFRIVNPLGFAGGSVVLTDNMDGTWTVVGTAAFDTNAYRLAFVEVSTVCCWKTISVEYSSTPENANTQYNCGANPTDADYGNGLGTGPLTVDLCAAGAVCADVDEAFTVTWTFEAC